MTSLNKFSAQSRKLINLFQRQTVDSLTGYKLKPLTIIVKRLLSKMNYSHSLVLLFLYIFPGIIGTNRHKYIVRIWLK